MLANVLRKTPENRKNRCSDFSRSVNGKFDNSVKDLLGIDNDNCVNKRNNNGRNDTSRRYEMAMRTHPIDPIKFLNSAKRSRFC